MSAGGVGVSLRSPMAPAMEERRVPWPGSRACCGTAEVHRSGPAHDEVWRRLVQPEKDRDPEKKGYAVLIRVERSEDLDGQPPALD
jgi:hypothetical protein